MTRRIGLLLVVLSLANAATARAQPWTGFGPTSAQLFLLFPAPPALATSTPIAGLDATKGESLIRLPGDADSVFTLGGPCPSGQARIRFAVEVNEAILKTLAPDPRVEANDMRGRSGGDWKPIDSSGRPYQLRLGARIIW